jgi:hypothetical protein
MQRRETETEYRSDRSDTTLKTGSLPPTKVVHYMLKCNAKLYPRLDTRRSLTGRHATLSSHSNFLPGKSGRNVENYSSPKRF